MELKKRKYKKKEVKEIIDAVSSDNASITSELKAKIQELTIENAKLKARVTEASNDELVAHKVIKDAEITALKIKKEAEDYCELTILNMQKLSKAWQEFFDLLSEKYPNYKVVKEAVETKKSIDKILFAENATNKTETIKKILDDNSAVKAIFDPQAKINEYISATSDSGFNLDEVLNPGELELEDLCKELGLIEPKK